MHLKNGDIVQHNTEHDVFGIICEGTEYIVVRYIIRNRSPHHYKASCTSLTDALEYWKKVD